MEIHFDLAATPEQRLFLLAHLFGHTVQWNSDPAAFEIGRRHRPPVDERLFPKIIEYELEAACYGLALCHEAGVRRIEQWFSSYADCDQKYPLHYYRTGEKDEFHSFWSENAPLVQRKAIPPFKPVRRAFRMDGIVI